MSQNKKYIRKKLLRRLMTRMIKLDSGPMQFVDVANITKKGEISFTELSTNGRKGNRSYSGNLLRVQLWILMRKERRMRWRVRKKKTCKRHWAGDWTISLSFSPLPILFALCLWHKLLCALQSLARELRPPRFALCDSWSHEPLLSPNLTGATCARW